MAAHSGLERAAVYNVPGAHRRRRRRWSPASARPAPGARITWGGAPLPFPAALEAVGFDRDVGPFPRTPLADGVAATVAHFRRTLASS